MSTLPASEVRRPALGVVRLAPFQLAAVCSALAVIGLSTIWSAVLLLWDLWTTDALKSIGMAVPVVSFALILRAWRGLEWEMDGTWWGLVVLIATVVAVRLRVEALLMLTLTPQWAIMFPPPSLVALAYGSGVVLLFGGARLYRAALFPILLLWFVNPTPRIFNVYVDLPLQHASAHVARAFAMALGQTLTPDNLKLMFTPDFGMFIAPGCNGIRGAVTMGFIALIAGYVYRFRWYVNALVVLAAVLTGYVFNFARLCLLVLYYLVALHFTSLQSMARNADFVIGGILFLGATLLLFTVIDRFRGSSPAETPKPASPAHATTTGAMLYARIAAMAALALLGCAQVAQARANPGPHVAATNIDAAKFPAHLGNFTLIRSWNETMNTGTIVYVWAQYAPAGGGTPISIGISPELGVHDVMMCHQARGDDPLWHSQITEPTAGGVPVNFTSAFYNNGTSQYLEVSTLCQISSCGEFQTASGSNHFGFMYSRPDPKSLLNNPQSPIPILLRAETVDTNLPADTARTQLTESMRNFLASVDLASLSQPYRH